MTERPTDLTDRPGDDPARALREALRCLTLSGSIFLRAEFSAPWAYESPEQEEIAGMLRPGHRRVVLFHIFTEGGCRLKLRRGEEADIEAGDIIIFPYADTHRLGDPSVENAVPIRELMAPPPWSTFPVIRLGGGGSRSAMVCGYLYCDDQPFNPVLSSLPPVLKVRPESGGPLARFVDASIEYAIACMENTVASDPLGPRLPELLFTEALCEYARQEQADRGGWLAALADPVVGRALSCVHREPAFPWTLELLARRAASSRSVLDDRFRTLLGQAPMSYVTAFRLQLASRKLETTGAGLAEIAAETGYGSEASLSRAFKRHVGVSPSQWRQAARRASESP